MLRAGSHKVGWQILWWNFTILGGRPMIRLYLAGLTTTLPHWYRSNQLRRTTNKTYWVNNHILIAGRCWREFDKFIHPLTRQSETHVCNAHMGPRLLFVFLRRGKIKPPTCSWPPMEPTRPGRRGAPFYGAQWMLPMGTTKNLEKPRKALTKTHF